MIVRILGEGQYSIPDAKRAGLETLDGELLAAVEARDEDAFAKSLAALTDAVRTAGEALPDDTFAPSDLVVPFADASLTETEELLSDASEPATDEA